MEEERGSVSSRRLHLRRPGDFRRLGLPPVRARVRLATRVPGRRPSFGRRPSGRLTRLKAWFLPFLAFFGLYASSSVCVFCGSPGCPVGAGAAAVAGGFFAALWQGGMRGGQWLLGLLEGFRRACRGEGHAAAENQKL